MMNSPQTPSDAERAAAAAAESAAAYQKYVVQPGMESVKDEVQQTKQTVQAAAERAKKQAQAKVGKAKQQAQAKAEEVKQQARNLIHQRIAKLPPPMATRVEALMTTAKQRPLPTTAVTMVILLVLGRLLRRSR
jgi:biopolymer transport protein ExbB/TolQ